MELSILAVDVITGGGLLLTLIGAAITARSVILREDDALNIGLPKFTSDHRAENLAMPMVQNLLASSRGARRGLVIVAVGTGLQLVPIGWRMASLMVS